MRYFIDTEFSEQGPYRPIDLISIGIVAENGREFYGVNNHFRWDGASIWLHENVKPHLFDEHEPTSFGPLGWLTSDVRAFIEKNGEPEFWGYYCAYDYVVLSQLMGGMADWPDGWPYYMHDLRQWLDERGLQNVKQPDDAIHNALTDARWIRDTLIASGHGEKA
jgi:hypothetical protein